MTDAQLDDASYTVDHSGQGGELTYAVDIVMCIDTTLSMRPVIEEVKANAISFRERFAAKLAAKEGKRVEQLRVRVIAFRDFGFDAEALRTSDFFVLPEEQTAFESFVRGLEHGGGGDEPESALDALALALRSDWVQGLDRRRHVVIMFTDATSHPLAHASGHAQYPAGIASNMDELADEWDGGSQLSALDKTGKRLLLFAPDGHPWSELPSDFDLAIHYPSMAGRGIEDHDFDNILELLAESI